MTSNNGSKEAYVWIWLPGETQPIVAGKLEVDNDGIHFNYGKSYLERKNEKSPPISIYDPELPLTRGIIPLQDNLKMPACIRDGSPDAWGRRVILNKKFGVKGNEIDTIELDEITYLLESGSDRIGALDFQQSPTEYVPRQVQDATLSELLESAEKVERGIPLSEELGMALLYGSSIGGARPKALIRNGNKKHIAKFSSSDDTYSVVKAEFIAMRLAEICGLNVAPVKLERALDKDVLLIERFDKVFTEKGWTRKAMVSALTLLGLDDMMDRYASYQEFAEIIRHRFSQPKETLKEIYSRLVFNILSGNTDDHARNHAAFWDGKNLQLTPAYDICPQRRSGGEASQAMLITGKTNLSQLKYCVTAARNFLLEEKEAEIIIEHMTQTIKENWDKVCEEAQISKVDKNLLWERQFLNPFAFEN